MDILITGVGGQGIILASKILAYAYVIEGRNARTGETIGMSQRGGCVVSHVRAGNAHSPYIPVGGADLLLSFELCEGARRIPYLKKDGFAIVNTAMIIPVSTALGKSDYDVEKITKYISENTNAIFIDADRIAQECGSFRAVNTVLIGAACGLGVLELSTDSIIQSMKKNIRAQYLDLNINAFHSGMKATEEMREKCKIM
ncbi:MAG: indolepyruvate oxidoreductase subunit beta [Clostridiaceae bacterium]|nr:indolepyruvate oxidoreductase subunit beta [Clostridiaceae bacterium]